MNILFLFLIVFAGAYEMTAGIGPILARSGRFSTSQVNYASNFFITCILIVAKHSWPTI